MKATLCDICGHKVEYDIDTKTRGPIKFKYKGLKLFDEWLQIDICPRCADNIRTMSSNASRDTDISEE